jgi:ferritin-like metal-binding protein YciE
MSTRTLDDLLVHELRELYDADHQLVKMLASLSREIHDAHTAQLLNTLRCEIRNHVFGLEQILSTLGQVPRRVRCRWLDGMAECYHAFQRTRPSQSVVDTYDLAHALKAIRTVGSSYRILITLALRLNYPQIVDMLRQQLWDMESAAERLQSQLGRSNRGETGAGPAADQVTTFSVVAHLAPSILPFSDTASAQLPPESPEDRENVLAGGQEIM